MLEAFLGESINSPESSLSHASPRSPGMPENEDYLGEHTSQNHNNEGVLVMLQEFLCGFSNFTTEISKKMENLSQQNTLLLNKRSEQENFERKRSHSPEHSSSPDSFVPHYNKKYKSHSISASSTPVQDEQSSLPTVEAPQVVLGANETPKTVLSSFIEGDYTYNLLSEDHKKDG